MTYHRKKRSCSDYAPISPQVINSVVVTKVEEQGEIQFRRLRFTAGVDQQPEDDLGPVDDSIMMPFGQGVTHIVINEQHILPNSVNLIINGVPIGMGANDEISITSITYGVNGIDILLNQPSLGGQRYIVSYAKKVTV